MWQFLKFAAALVVAVAIVAVIRVFAFTIYTVPVSIGKKMMAGDKVVVNKLARSGDFGRGDIMSVTIEGEAHPYSLMGQPQQLGEVIAVPGDTVMVKGQRYRIPYKCCDKCQCRDCKLYLVETGYAKRLVHKHQVVGRAWNIFR